ncbi:MAG: penicillin acylase family protein [Steroidobacterales bacterium]
MWRCLKYTAAACALLLLAALATGYGTLRASLPRLAGSLREPGLSAAVSISRDALGVPTITAANRSDLAYATGFVHAQDRYFQMDLSRRLAAGELAELFGPLALPQDRNTRLFRFRTVAQAVIAQAAPGQRALVESYTRGVNAGLKQLGSRPWEYWLLRQRPRGWAPEDTVLVEYAMWWDLQANGLRREILRREVNARLGGAECAAGWKCALAFLYPAGTSWDAPVALPGAAEPVSELPPPAADVLDVRGAAATEAPDAARAPSAGSNSWAVAGRLTATGAALVANDMHLSQRVPPVWYRARLRTTAGAVLDLNGVTLPGAPLLVAGSNGHVAWGFTNSYGNWLDVERVACKTTADASLRVTVEEIRVKGAPPVQLQVRSGPAGVLLRTDPEAHVCWFGAWLAQLPAATNLNLMNLERAASVTEVLSMAPDIGIPHQNLVVGDAEGHIGWTIAGRIPEGSAAARVREVSTWTTPADHPRIVDPASGRIWTANARVATEPRQQALIGGDLTALGVEYDLGARAGQIRDDLLALNGSLKPADMLRIQLDDRALFLERWRVLLLSTLDAAATNGHPRRAGFRALVAQWDGHAATESVGYRLVRTWHDGVQERVWQMLLTALKVPPEDMFVPPAQFEGPLWQLVSTQPPNMLARPYADWSEFLLAQVDAVSAQLLRSCGELASCTWGRYNTVRVQHPLSRALPWLAWFLDMPTVELPGDHDMPRVQNGAFGASERFAVSPGHEAAGYFHMPGGQSGHPLSPYYRAGFMQWARGEPLPFLPGAAQHTLTLTPR